MYTPEALLDLHARAQCSLRKVLEHARSLAPGDLDRELPGFGYPSVRKQIHHIIGAQEYWLGVLEDRYDVEEDLEEYPTIESLEHFRVEVAERTDRYLGRATTAELNTPREMKTWPDRIRRLMPAHVVLRTQMHVYHHQGQILAMCRLLGQPAPAGLDFPIDERVGGGDVRAGGVPTP